MLKFAAGAAILAFALTSCSKKDDNTSSAPAYLPNTIIDVNTGLAVDSFVFKNNIIQSVYSNQQENGAWQYQYVFVYGTDGKCKQVKQLKPATSEVTYLDSVVYNGDKITIYSHAPGVETMDSDVYRMSNNFAVTYGSKDTVINADSKSLNYGEYTISGNNLSKESYSYYYLNIPTKQSTSFDYSRTYYYEDTPNGFQLAFERNPFLYFYLCTYQEELTVPASKGNFIKMESTENSNGTVSNETMTVVNTYDATTGLLSTQKVTSGSDNYWNSKFTFRKAD